MSEEHVDEIKKSQFNRQRTETKVLRKNCVEGYIFTDISKTSGNTVSSGQSEFHHVLPIAALQTGNIDIDDNEVINYIHNCMAATIWDINDEPNLIGLPTKSVYLAADVWLKKNNNLTDDKGLALLKKLDPKKSGFGALPDLPCHKVGHDKFNDKVIEYLDKNLWRQLKPQIPCKDQSKSLKIRLNTASKIFRDWLKKRGVGAAYCWVHRDTTSKWYVPFSMAPTPQARKAPPKLHNRKGTQDEWKKKLFSRL